VGTGGHVDHEHPFKQLGQAGIDIGRRLPAFPVTPRYKRVRIRRFSRLSDRPPVHTCLNWSSLVGLSTGRFAASDSVTSSTALKASPVSSVGKARSYQIFSRLSLMSSAAYSPLLTVKPSSLSILQCPRLTPPGLNRSLSPQAWYQDRREVSRGKLNRLQRTTARFTTRTLNGYGLRKSMLARPARYASYLVLVHRATPLLHAAFIPRLTMTPLHFAMTSPPSSCQRDLHPQAVEHARGTWFWALLPKQKGLVARGRNPA